MPPIKTGYCTKEGEVTEKFVNFYRRRAKYLGAVIPEPLRIDKGLRELPNQVGIEDDSKIPGLAKLTSAIRESGAKAIAHLNHPGRMANPKIPGNYFLSSTDRACENGGATPNRMSLNDMRAAIDLLVAAAKRAEEAGFDVIELQFGHGYLFSQFLSPEVNDRNDEFGGDFESRINFPLQAFDAVKKLVDLPIIARISGEEQTPNGIKIKESIEFAKALAKRGASAIHVSSGSLCSSPAWFFQHMFAPLGKPWESAAAIQKEIDIPVVFVGRINSFDKIKKIEKKYSPKYIAVGRALLADPDFVGKYIGEISDSPRPCAACSDGCLGGVKSGKGLSCVMNPLLGEDFETLEKTTSEKKVAVVGAGLAGCEAALTLRKRGHTVDLYEKDEIGGLFNLAHLPPNKESLKAIVDFYKQEIEKSDIIFIREEATEETLLSGKYDEVVLATGSKPVNPPVEGLTKYYWADAATDLEIEKDDKYLVVGGGLIGTEVASTLMEKGAKVILVEALEELARGMEMIEKNMTLKKLKTGGAEIYPLTKVAKVEGDKCYLVGYTKKTVDGIKGVIATIGMKPETELARKLEGKIKYRLIGDANQPRKAIDAIREGYDAGKSI